VPSGGGDVSAVVATYRRPAHLKRCLEGLLAQTAPPIEIVVVRRPEDGETASVLAGLPVPVREVLVEARGVVAALSTASRAARGSILAFTDDDAVPRPDWVERLTDRFSDRTVGAVGGRDVLHNEERVLPPTDDVGRVTRWGKVVGNHHRGAGRAREIHVLKAVNMAFRREALVFPSGLRGRGAQVNFEVAMCLAARSRGWRVLFDPAIAVDHYPGPRFGADRRGRPEAAALRDAAYNEVAALLSLRPSLFRRRALYGLLVGNIGSPGLVRAAAGAARGESEAVRRLLPSLAGQAAALFDHVRGHRVGLEPLDEPGASRPYRRKVLITVPLGERLGGAENMLWTFLRHVDRGRVQPVVVFLHRGRFATEVRGLGVQTIVLEAGRLRQGWRFLRTVHSLMNVLRSEQPDLVVNWMGKSQLYGALAAALAGMTDRVIWWQHLTPDGHWLDRLATLLPARGVGCSSIASATAQRRHRPVRPTFVVHPGIDSPPALAEKEARELRRGLGIPDGRTIVGILGRLQPWKGQDRFLRALAILRARGHAVHGLVVGGDAYGLAPGFARHLDELARTLKLSGSVTFAGQVETAGPYLGVMDILVNASVGEPFGIVLIEAMAMGLPVVAVERGGPTEIVEAGRSGLLVPRGDAVELADAVERLVCDGVLRRRLGERGRERFQQRFRAERMTRELEHRMEALIKR
jgi:glycosyltransferase involved in cell wall biosynthesis/GT2 family glycosyltransferase